MLSYLSFAHGTSSPLIIACSSKFARSHTDSVFFSNMYRCCCCGVIPSPYNSVATACASSMMHFALPMMSKESTFPKFSINPCTRLMKAGGVMTGVPSTHSPLTSSCTCCGRKNSYNNPFRSSGSSSFSRARSRRCSSGCRRSRSRSTRSISFRSTSAAGIAPAAVACWMLASISRMSASSTSPRRVIIPISACIRFGLPFLRIWSRRSCADPMLSAMTSWMVLCRSTYCWASTSAPYSWQSLISASSICMKS
mmetsp:Transcript_14060/g.23411  ORF Transcript_14060/g.23411 Transcript_14060/m.23411 type:complete len:253 (+) Transcript_14060:244-1002(+)